MNGERFDTVVIGGGIVGSTCAFYLARAGLRVALVERERVAAGTTGRSFAWINATSKVADEAYHRLNALGQARYRALAVEFGEERIGLNPTGMLRCVRRSDETDYSAVKAQADRLAAFGYPAAWIGRDALGALEPHMALEDDAEALYAMADPCLDAPRFARFMADGVEDQGGVVLEGCGALELAVTDAGRVAGVVTDRGRLDCGNVVVATGPGTPDVLAALTGHAGFASRFPITGSRGLLVTTPSTAPHRLVRHVVYTRDCHVLPAPGGGLKIGADDTDGAVADDPGEAARDAAARALLRRAARLLPGFAGEACFDECRITVGVRPMPRDGRSIVGPLPGAENLFVAVTHSGVTLAPALGELLAERIVSGRTPEALGPFGMERFAASR